MNSKKFFKNRNFLKTVSIVFLLFFFLPLPASAHLFSNEDESIAAYNALAKDKHLYDMQQASSDSLLQLIANRLVQGNPKYLNFNDGKHKRWLEPFWVMGGNEERNAASIGGFVEISEGYARLCDAVFKNGKQTGEVRMNRVRTITNNSSIAAILAHECAHFAREDWKRASYREVKGAYRAELAADELGMEFLSNTPEFSPGSAITVRLRNADTEYTSNSGRHPSNATRIEKECKVLERLSKGRVKVAQDGRTRIDGRLLNGTGYLPDSEDSDNEERTLYVAGQVASLIGKGKWKKQLLSCEPESDILDGGKKDKTLLIARSEPNGKMIKIIGAFDYDSTKQAGRRTDKEKKEAALAEEIESSAT